MNTDSWLILLTAVIAMATVIYSGVTIWLSLETRWQRRAMSTPRLVCEIRPSSRNAPWPELIVQNVGMNPAFDIRFNGMNELSSRQKEFLGDRALDCLRAGMSSLRPGATIVSDLPHLHAQDKIDLRKERLSLSIEFGEQPNSPKHFTVPVVLDYSTTGYTLETTSDPLRLIDRRLQDINDTLRRLAESKTDS